MKYCLTTQKKEWQEWEGSWELIDGVPYAIAPAPLISHQEIKSVEVYLNENGVYRLIDSFTDGEFAVMIYGCEVRISIEEVFEGAE